MTIQHSESDDDSQQQPDAQKTETRTPPRDAVQEFFDGIRGVSTVQDFLTAVLGFSAVFIAVGYIVVERYLQLYMAPVTYQVANRQYISAGLSVIIIYVGIFAVIYFIKRLLQIIRYPLLHYTTLVIITLTLSVIASEVMIYLFHGNITDGDIPKVLSDARFNFLEFFVTVSLFCVLLLIRSSKTWRAVVTLSAIALGITSLVFFGDVYHYIPRYFGGGEPDDVVLIFEDRQSLLQTGLIPDDLYHQALDKSGSASDGLMGGRYQSWDDYLSASVCLLTETQSGLLVYDLKGGKREQTIHLSNSTNYIVRDLGRKDTLLCSRGSRSNTGVDNCQLLQAWDEAGLPVARLEAEKEEACRSGADLEEARELVPAND